MSLNLRCRDVSGVSIFFWKNVRPRSQQCASNYHTNSTDCPHGFSLWLNGFEVRTLPIRRIEVLRRPAEPHLNSLVGQNRFGFAVTTIDDRKSHLDLSDVDRKSPAGTTTL
ncbi:hypothetical protein Agabi119p4_10436 [Agaricus bisporus var. burnettii]|uniref:Uncharacterized protein n=1 Tax=Agaricus bisporus var. burnettii TaxID=192524 RepID=A0A8H7C215_AGABI|nr:hypothetical protein Agabi119p4_10436 [Agaricus bisporus var. burnettii]